MADDTRPTTGTPPTTPAAPQASDDDRREQENRSLVYIPSQVTAPVKLSGYDFWRQTLRSARLVVAPMVDASELAWRMLSRRHGAQLCYTPMLHASVFVKDARYRADSLQTCAEDRPLIIQFCANDADVLCQAATLAAPYCDAIDLNLGCPQAIARRGNYGAFLQDEWDLISSMITKCHRNVPVPITAKIRVFEDLKKTVKYAKLLEQSGCQLLTVHGRTREQKGMQTGLASWAHIRAVKDELNIPVFSNGNIQYLSDVERCIEETSVDGVMTAEGNLHNPALFEGRDPPIYDMAEEYLDLVDQYPCPLSYARGHLFKLFQHFLPRHTDVRDALSTTHDFTGLRKVTALVRERCLVAMETPDTCRPYWSGIQEDLKLPFWLCQPYERRPVTTSERKRPVDDVTDVIIDGTKLSRNQAKKLKRNPNKRFESQPSAYSICTSCPNPRGLKCENLLCRACCKSKSYHGTLDCDAHNFKFKTKREKAKTH